MQNQLQVFKERFGSIPRVFRAPGRINLIGEHTDYNNGFVMPAAVDKQITLYINKNGSETFRIHSLDQNEDFEFRINEYSKSESGWQNYIIGIVDQLFKKGVRLEGFDLMFGGDIPIGAGMSSSAALSCGTALAVNELYNTRLDRQEMAFLAQKSEQQYVGVNCGIMDQFASLFSKKDYAIKLDCSDLSYDFEPLALEDTELILVNSMVSHSLASSEYNIRRQECEAVVAKAIQEGINAQSLRGINRNQLNSLKEAVSEKEFQRASFVLDENERVAKASWAMESGDLKSLGSLINQSHKGLSNDYEVSCAELDFLQSEATRLPGVLGSRMMGGGFGGCTLNLLEVKHSGEFQEKISKSYQEKYGQSPELYFVKTADGATEIKV